jgi:SAM-dependent methyltransferase
MPEYALRPSDAEVQRYRIMAEHARKAEGELWGLAGIAPGATVGDIGCGPGGVLPALAEAVGPSGAVHALDGDAEAQARAAALIEAAGLTNTDVRTGRADDTGFDPASFDVVMMRHVLAHNGGREQAIVNHLAQLVRPGGVVYLVDSDGTAVRNRNADPDLADLSDKYAQLHARRGNDVQVGLRLDELLEGAGLDVVAYRAWYLILPLPPGLRPPAWAARQEIVSEGLATREDVARWDAAFDRLDAPDLPGRQRMTVFVPNFAALGRRGHRDRSA